MSGPAEALVVIDMLNDFCTPGAPLFVPMTRQVIPNIARELARARAAGIPVVYLCDAHSEDDPEFANWPRHSVAGSEGARVTGELAPVPGDHVVPKTTLLGFYNTRLAGVLKSLGARTLTITGCVTNICVMLVATEAVVRGYRVKVPKDCVAGLDPEMHEFALRQMRDVIKAEII